MFLSGVAGVVRNDAGQVLLGRRSDTGLWSVPSGILEPGEQPAEGLAREIEEETCVVVSVDSVVSVWTLPEMTYPNGDRSQYLDVCFLCSHVSGEPAVGDGELTEVAWFDPDSLPDDLGPSARLKLERALAFTGRATFDGDRYAAVPGPGADRTERRVLATFRDGDRDVVVRRATDADLPAIVRLLADDELGATREDEGDLAAYRRGLAAIDADPHQLLVVLDDDGEVVGTLQLTLIPGISHQGAWRAQIEAVRVAADRRGSGLGGQMVQWAVQESRSRGARVVQLTSNAVRADARRFYERLGFIPSHTGFKLPLSD
nr:GNAT family N-acetyltransferase [Knoellia sp. DB2414S]